MFKEWIGPHRLFDDGINCLRTSTRSSKVVNTRNRAPFLDMS